MTFNSCPDRDRILAASGHVVVTGGPGCGKTTVALRKALLRINAGMEPGQKVLFLSFSRAAVARIVEAARKDLPREVRASLEIQTFHSFCWQLVRGHGYLLGAPTPIKLIAPHDERARRNGAKDHDPLWDAELERLFSEEGLIAFDLFAPKARQLLSRSVAFRKLVAEKYPLIIVDEAQDTGTEQWECIASLAAYTQLICLADLDQQIYDFRRDVSPDRLAHILAALNPLEVALGAQNNRSPGVEIVQFGNDILANTPRGGPYRGVSQVMFNPTAAERDKSIRRAVGIIYQTIKKETGLSPASVGYLTNWGKGVAVIARALQGDGGTIGEIPHRVVVDEAEVLLATRVVALCLEPVIDVWATLATGLNLIAEVYRGQGKTDKVQTLTGAADAAAKGELARRAKCPAALKTILGSLQATPLTGEPGADWLHIRRLFEMSDVDELKRIAQLVIYLLAFNRGRRITDSLAEKWQRRGCYADARVIMEAAISEDQIVGSDGSLDGINVMTMHKSKGKEFDGVILLHLGRLSPFSPDSEPAPHQRSRRLLRVGITRARRHTIILTDAFSPSPLLRGHVLT